MHSHDHAHSHDGDAKGHHHHGLVKAPGRLGMAFSIGLILNLGFVVIEFVYGLIAQSMALVADAGHNMGDVLGLALAWLASLLVDRRPSVRRTYGFKRSSILASVANAVVLLVTTGAIAMEAARRLFEPEPIATTPVIAVAAIGIVINAITAWLLHRSHGGTGHDHGPDQGHERGASGREDLNVWSVIVHFGADALISAAVVVSGVIIAETHYYWLDPVLGLAVAAVILVGTWSLLRQSLNLALDAVPENIDPDAVGDYLLGLPGVTEIHDLHIWAMSTTETALTVHLICPEHSMDDAMLADAACQLADRFRIGHATFQIERGDRAYPCGLAPAEIV